jgi:hypothetical protein
MNNEVKKDWALIFSDAHLTHAQLEKDPSGFYSIKLLENIKFLIDKFNPEYVFNLGDTFHLKDTTSATLLYIYYQFLKDITQKRKVIELVGNHDFSFTATDNNFTYNPFRLFQMDNLTTVNDSFRLDEDNIFISYSRDKDLFNKRLAALGGAKRLFGHLDINGFNLGDDYIEKYAIFEPDEFSAFEQVFSGHYHEPQEKQINDNLKITYIGSPATHNFGESDKERRVILINLKTGMNRSVPTDMTYHKTLHITTKDKLPEINNEEILAGIKYRIIVEGSEAEYSEFKKKIPKEFKEKIKIIPKFTTKEVSRIEIKENETKEDIIKKYTEKEIDKFFSNLEAEDKKKKMLKLEEYGNKYIKKAFK